MSVAERSSPRMDVRFLVAGDTAVVVEFGDRIDREVSNRVLRLSALVRASNTQGIVETVPTYRSLLVHYDPLVVDSASARRRAATRRSQLSSRRTFL